MLPTLENILKEDYSNFLSNVKNKCTNLENTELIVNQLVKKINFFFEQERLDSCVLGISGGIDSAVVLALLVRAQKEPNSPLKKILPLSLPFINSLGATGQEEARDSANLVCKTLTGEDIKVIDMSPVYNALLLSSDVEENDENSWANGQMLSVMRTPVLYHQCALLQKDGYKSITVGTINKTEFKLGYWGKASDMMVDFQPIIDLYKFEVYNIARFLNVPDEIINKAPKGDVSTGETDLDMMGAPYEFIDMYLESQQFGNSIVPFFDTRNYVVYIDNLYQKQIKRNKHKFSVGYPCRFLKRDYNWDERCYEYNTV